MKNCRDCGKEFNLYETKHITKIEPFEIGITSQGFDPSYAIKEALCQNCYNKRMNKK